MDYLKKNDREFRCRFDTGLILNSTYVDRKINKLSTIGWFAHFCDFQFPVSLQKTSIIIEDHNLFDLKKIEEIIIAHVTGAVDCFFCTTNVRYIGSSVLPIIDLNFYNQHDDGDIIITDYYQMFQKIKLGQFSKFTNKRIDALLSLGVSPWVIKNSQKRFLVAKENGGKLSIPMLYQYQLDFSEKQRNLLLGK